MVARALGVQLIDEGPFDYWASHSWAWENWLPVEIKNPSVEGHKHEYTEKQRRFMDAWRESGRRWLVWRTREDVFRDAKVEST